MCANLSVQTRPAWYWISLRDTSLKALNYWSGSKWYAVASATIFGISVLVSDMIVISKLVMSIVERESSGFKITVKQPITQCASFNLASHLWHI